VTAPSPILRDAATRGPDSSGADTSGADPSGPDSNSGGPGTLVVRGLTRRFGAHVALHPLELTVARGTVAGLLGPNGSGKSTLMRMLTGLVRPDAGQAWVDGVALSGDGLAIRRRASYAPGELKLRTELRADHHLDWLLEGRTPLERERARALARTLELPLEKKVRAYSHGMKRQLLFAAALAPELPVRILDEPTEGLDPAKRAQVLELLRADVAAGRTVLLSSHHLAEVHRACAQLVFLDRGRCIANERASAVVERTRRILRLRFAEPQDMALLQERAAGWGAVGVRQREGLVTFELARPDPREFLARATADRAFGAPLSIEYGPFSLQELYRDLYGVEGC